MGGAGKVRSGAGTLAPRPGELIAMAPEPSGLRISRQLVIPLEEIEIRAIRAQGAGGQHVNKVSSAIHLRFDIDASSLPPECRERLKALGDGRVSRESVVVIKAQRFRSQEKNREEALERLRELIRRALTVRKARRPTRPTKSSQQKRMDRKTKRGETKSLRGRIDY